VKILPDESLADSKAGQPRGDCPYPKNLDCCRGCTTGQAPNLGYRTNSFRVTSVITLCNKINQLRDFIYQVNHDSYKVVTANF
jgi:hypothetical protein